MKRKGLTRRKDLSRRAQLRRTARLARKTPLAPAKGANPSAALVRQALQRSKGLKARSDATAKFYAEERVPFVRVWLVRYPFCEAQLAVCTRRSRVVHETWTRGRAGKPNTYLVPRRAPEGADEETVRAVWEQNRRQFLTLCDPCHDWIHRHPREAREIFVTREGVPIRLLRRTLDE